MVVWLANRVLRFASPRYRAMLEGSIRYGMLSAAKDELAQNDGSTDG